MDSRARYLQLIEDAYGVGGQRRDRAFRAQGGSSRVSSSMRGSGPWGGRGTKASYRKSLKTRCKPLVSRALAQQRKTKRQTSGRKSAKSNPWLQFVRQVRDACPEMSYTEALQVAGPLYRQMNSQGVTRQRFFRENDIGCEVEDEDEIEEGRQSRLREVILGQMKQDKRKARASSRAARARSRLDDWEDRHRDDRSDDDEPARSRLDDWEERHREDEDDRRDDDVDDILGELDQSLIDEY